MDHLPEPSTRPELSLQLRGLEDFQSLYSGQPHLFNQEWIMQIAKGAVAVGAMEPLTDASIPPYQMEGLENLREGLVYRSISSRMRAVMLCIQNLLAGRSDPKIYATEAVTAFALRLRGIFPKFIGSEYAATEAQRDELFPIVCQDLQNLTHPDRSFDVVTTNEVLEHVPSIDAALHEIYRVLKPGGWHIGTVPFAYGQHESILKAKLVEGAVVYLMEPEFHGKQGSLVFEVPGWNILDRAKAVGFADAHMKYVMSATHACFSDRSGGIFVLCLQR